MKVFLSMAKEEITGRLCAVLTSNRFGKGGPSLLLSVFVLGWGELCVGASPNSTFSCYLSGGLCTTCWGCKPDGVFGVCV